GNLGRPHSSAKATRNITVSTSAIPTAPATFHGTFSHVTQKSVARNSVPVIFTRGSSTRRRAPRRARHGPGARDRPQRGASRSARRPATSDGAPSARPSRPERRRPQRPRRHRSHGSGPRPHHL